MKFFISVFIVILLVGCGNNSSYVSGDDKEVTITRMEPYGHASLIVKKAPPGKADETLAEAQGYVEAEDRFFQMDLMRRFARGRLAELLGENTLNQQTQDPLEAIEKDKQIHDVGLVDASAKSLEKLKQSPEAYALVEAFTRGVNRLLGEIDQKRPELLSYYRKKITKDPTYRPLPWEPEDSVAVGLAMSFVMSSSLDEESNLAGMVMEVGGLSNDLDFRDFLDLRPIENISIMPLKHIPTPSSRIETTAKNNQKNRSPLRPFKNSFCDFPFPPCGGRGMLASNNWVVSRQLTRDKDAVILLNDPHLMWSSPANFVEFALDSVSAGGTIRSRGVNLPGVPFILIGHNENFAWGMTNSMSDVCDMYIEMLDDDRLETAKNVIFKNETIPLREVQYDIKVRYGSKVVEVPHTVKFVPHHGPILSDPLFVSYRWIGHDGGNEISAILGLNRAKNFEEFKLALQKFEVGAQNIIYGDRQGNIGYYSHGRFPLRPFASKENLPYLTLEGYQGETEWAKEYRTNFPELYNPIEGRIVTANNDPYGYNQLRNLSDFYDYFGFRFDVGGRARRIANVLDEGDITVEKMKALQYDHLDLIALNFINLIPKGLERVLSEDSEEMNLLHRLWNWDGQVKREKREPLLFYVWLFSLFETDFRDYLKSDALYEKLISSKYYNEYVQSSAGLNTLFHRVRARKDNLEAAIPFFKQSIKRAINRLYESGNINKTWGEVHRLEFYNLLSFFFPKFPIYISDIGRHGSWETVDLGGSLIPQTYGKFPDKLPSNYAPNFRLIMVLKNDSIEGFNVLPGGPKEFIPSQSDLDTYIRLQLDSNRWNETRLWNEGEYRDLVPFAK